MTSIQRLLFRLWILQWVLAPFSGSLAYSTARSRKISSLEVETGLKERGYSYILGSDESGSGCIAGPIVVASCTLLLEDHEILEEVKDCKALGRGPRLELYQKIVAQPELYGWTTSVATNTVIDELNVIQATKQCIRTSIEDLVAEHELPHDMTYSIVDGYKTPKLTIPVSCRPYVKGDAEVYTVALASILAKVTHEQLMQKAHEEYPEYGFDKHKGYPTRPHIEAIHKHGPCPLHRMTAKPLKGRDYKP